MNAAQIALDNIARFGEYKAIYFEGKGYTNVEMYNHACRMGEMLRAHGVKPADRVVVMMLNSNDVLSAFIAIWKIGAVIIPITPMWTAREARYVLENSGAQIAVTSPELVACLKEASTGIAEFREILVMGETEITGSFNVLPEIEKAAPFEPLVDRQPDDMALLLYTSGTTGNPKGVMLSHENLLFINDSVYKHNESLGQIRSMIVLPLSHIYGILMMNLGYRLGCKWSILRRFDAGEALETIQDFKVERLSVVPTMLSYLINHPDREKYDYSSLESVNSGGAAMSEAVRQEFARLFSCRVVQGYGLSETAGALTGFAPDEDYVTGSVGRSLPGVETCIMDFDNRMLPPGETGEICARGKHIMRGYLNNEEATNEAIIDGWLHTGDIGYINEDGYVFITDRKKDLIIKGGENISPREIEEGIYSHPAIAEAAVFGVPDEIYGEEIIAAVVVRPGQSLAEDELRQHIAGYVTKFKIPSKIVFLESLPKNPTGKILKRALRERFALP